MIYYWSLDRRVPIFPGWREIRDVREAESSWMIYLLDEGRTSGGFGVAMLLDGLNYSEVSKGVLDCLDRRYHSD